MKVLKVKKTKKRNPGIIISFLNFVIEAVMKNLCSGFFGKLFTSYDGIEKKAKKGIILGGLSRAPGGREKSIRRKMLLLFDNSVIITLLKKFIRFLRGCKLNFYGAYFGSVGLYSLIIFLIRFYISNGNGFSAALLADGDFICSLLILIAAIPLLASKRTFASLVNESVSIRALLEDACGIPDDKFNEDVNENGSGAYFAAIVLGILTAGLTYSASPIKLILVIAALIVSILVLYFPELGLLGTISAVPFLGFLENPSLILGIMVGVTSISYFAKLLVGKRAFNLRLVDLAVMFFALLMFFGGVITMGGAASFKAASLYAVLMLGYVLVVNLVNTEMWIEKCASAIAVPSAIIAAYGVIGYTAVNMPAKWLDSSMFGAIASRAVSTFENPNMLATYLVITAPFIWRYLRKDGVSLKVRAIAAIGSVMSTACIVLTWSRGGWIGVVAAAVVFCLINYKHSLQYLVAFGVLSPIWIALLPSNISHRITSIGNLADTSTYYRLFTWKGSIKMLFEYFSSGVGVGESAFTQIYPFYAYSGVESTVHSHNLFLEIALELGVVGLVLFLLVAFMSAQRGFGCIKQNSKCRTRVCTVSVGIAGIFGALVHGMVDYVWYNYRVFFMFWIALAFICACANVYSKRDKDVKVYDDQDTGKASLDIIFGRE